MTQKTAAASRSVVLASDHPPVNTSNKEPSPITASTTSAGVLISAPTNGYQGGSFQITSIGSGNVVSFEQSNDSTDGINGTWDILNVWKSTAINQPQVSFNSTGFFHYSTAAAYIRARVSTYGSGTVTIYLAQKAGVRALEGVVLSNSNASIGNINSSVGFLDSTTALGASASYIGSARITSSYGPYSYFNVLAYADVAGTLYIDWSADSGSTWQTHSSTPVAAGTTQSLAASLVGFVAAVQFRARYVNGAGAQTVFRLATSFTVS